MPLPACSAAQRRAIGGLLARAVATAAERAGSCAGLADPGRSGCLQAGRAAGEQAALGLRRFAGQGSGGGGRGAGRLVGFVFDIDGVLQRGTRMLPAGLQAVQLLYESDRTTPRYPVCFMTNGGGTTEGQRAQELSERLDVAVHESQVVLSHTPMQHLVPRFRDHPVLVCGRHDVASVARSYGFRRPLTTSQIAAAFPDAVPFAPPPGAAAAAEQPCPLSAGGVGTEEAIRSVLVMTDPSNWYVDLQLLCDVVLGNGFLVMPDRGRSKSMQPEAEGVPVYFSNPDLLWANSFPRPRFGQGGFSTSFAALHRAVTGRPPPHVHFLGKPHAVQYRWTEQALAQQAVRLGLLPPSVLPHHAVGTDGDTTGLLHAPDAASLFSSIYMIGDNPASDIRGANLAGPPWIGVLVRTGVFQGVANDHRDRAAFVVDDALAAIRAAQHRERSAVWHSLR